MQVLLHLGELKRALEDFVKYEDRAPGPFQELVKKVCARIFI